MPKLKKIQKGTLIAFLITKRIFHHFPAQITYFPGSVSRDPSGLSVQTIKKSKNRMLIVFLITKSNTPPSLLTRPSGLSAKATKKGTFVVFLIIKK